MAIPLADFLARPNDTAILNTPCAACGTPLQSTVTGRQPSERGPVCDDCYFDQLGDIVERHPLGRLSSTSG